MLRDSRSTKRTENGQKDEYVQKSFAYAQEPHEHDAAKPSRAANVGSGSGVNGNGNRNWESKRNV